MNCNNEKFMQYMIFQAFRVTGLLTLFFWVITPPIRLHGVATRKTKIQMQNMWHSCSLHIKISQCNDLIFHVHSKSTQRQYESFPSSGISYKNYIWFAQNTFSLYSVNGLVTRPRTGEAKERGSIRNTGKRFCSSAKFPDWLCDPIHFLFKGHQG